VGVANLGADIWGWYDSSFADGDRKYFRQAERPDDIDYGFAELSIVNETGRDYQIDDLGVEGWNWHPREPARSRILARAGQPGSSMDVQTYLLRLHSAGHLRLRDGPDGQVRRIDFEVDRRRPTSCHVELRIREDGETVSACRPMRRVGPSFPWLLGPADY